MEILSHTEKGFRKYGESRFLRCVIGHMGSFFYFLSFALKPSLGERAVLNFVCAEIQKGKRNNGNMIIVGFLFFPLSV